MDVWWALPPDLGVNSRAQERPADQKLFQQADVLNDVGFRIKGAVCYDRRRNIRFLRLSELSPNAQLAEQPLNYMGNTVGADHRRNDRSLKISLITLILPESAAEMFWPTWVPMARNSGMLTNCTPV